jgi:hypothetical protein
VVSEKRHNNYFYRAIIYQTLFTHSKQEGVDTKWVEKSCFVRPKLLSVYKMNLICLLFFLCQEIDEYLIRELEKNSNKKFWKKIFNRKILKIILIKNF